jgi:hypothetical protein
MVEHQAIAGALLSEPLLSLLEQAGKTIATVNRISSRTGKLLDSVIDRYFLWILYYLVQSLARLA